MSSRDISWGFQPTDTMGTDPYIDTKVWVRIAKAARVTGLPATQIRNWVDADPPKIPYIQPGGEYSWRLVHLPTIMKRLVTK